jgi:hypothetical protein
VFASLCSFFFKVLSSLTWWLAAVATEGRKRARAETGECRVDAERGHMAD